MSTDFAAAFTSIVDAYDALPACNDEVRVASAVAVVDGVVPAALAAEICRRYAEGMWPTRGQRRELARLGAARLISCAACASVPG